MEERPTKRQKTYNTANNNNLMNDTEIKKEVETKLSADQKLLLAAKKENLEAMQLALKEGANINAKDEDEHTCLTLAATLDNLQMTKFLIKNGAEIGIKKKQLIISFYNENSKKVTFDEKEMTPLMIAAQNNYTELAAFLASKCNCNKEIKDAKDIAVQHKRNNIESILINQRYLNLNLFQAIEYNNFDEVKNALKNGANPKYLSEIDKLTALSKCIESKSGIKIIKLLLEHDPSIINLISDERTALFSAIVLDHKKSIFNNTDEKCVIELLINNGADVNIPGNISYEKYSTNAGPLMVAVLNNRIDIATLLIWNGADLNFKDAEGRTILELVQYILKGFVSEEQIISDKYSSALFAIDAGTGIYNEHAFKDMENLLNNAEKMKKNSRKKIINEIIPSTPLIPELAEISAQYII